MDATVAAAGPPRKPVESNGVCLDIDSSTVAPANHAVGITPYDILEDELTLVG